jgi:hypothetical protein
MLPDGNGGRNGMSKVIRCECGARVEPESDSGSADEHEGLLSAMARHIEDEHPLLAGALSRNMILAMVEEV